MERLDFPLVTLSSAASWEAAQALGVDRATWRDEYHRGVMELLVPYRLGLLVMAGYMLIVSPAMCRRYALLNLHPALPGGPTGTWQKVIWQLLEDEATETGAMVHLGTAQLDRGPVVSLLPLRPHRRRLGAAVGAVPREAQDDERRRRSPLPKARREPLFAEIRRRGEVREIPLLYQTLCQFAQGKLNTAAGAVFAESTRLPLDLTEPVEAEVLKR